MNADTVPVASAWQTGLENEALLCEVSWEVCQQLGGIQPMLKDRNEAPSNDLGISGEEGPPGTGRGGPTPPKKSRGTASLVLGVPIPDFVRGRVGPGTTKITHERVEPSVMPGDPARMAVGARAPQWVVDRLRTQMHLDQPIAVQYGYWLRDAVQGDFGLSLVTQRSVTNDIIEFFPASLELVLFSGVIAGIGGIGGQAQMFTSAKSAEKTLNQITWTLASIFMGLTIVLSAGWLTPKGL
jgi:hypothetical protein